MANKVGKALATIGTLTEVHTSALNPIMTIVEDAAGGAYIYMYGGTSVAVGTAVTYDEAGVVTALAADAIGPVAFSMAANTTTTSANWYCVRSPSGGMSVKTDSGVTDNALVYIDGTAGRVDDTVVAGDLRLNAVFRCTDTSNFSTVQFNFPSVNNTLG